MSLTATSPRCHRLFAVFLSGFGMTLLLGGCHSAYIEATVKNTTSESISPFEVDYPSASFGRTALAPGASYTYRFKVLGDGATKVLWTDAKHVDHTGSGPALAEGDEGTLSVALGTTSAQWTLTRKKAGGGS